LTKLIDLTIIIHKIPGHCEPLLSWTGLPSSSAVVSGSQRTAPSLRAKRGNLRNASPCKEGSLSC